MKRFHSICLAAAIWFSTMGFLYGNTQADSDWQISLLTCGPGTEIYNSFGHSAIRVSGKGNTDMVFNYGIFDFNTPHFALKFALGLTDYQLGVQSFRDFLIGYAMQGRAVREQTLNLTMEERQEVVRLLTENHKPQNRVYRYNYFYDNCATRPRDIIEKSLRRTLHYAADMTETRPESTFRKLVHQHTRHNAWGQFGIDLALGTDADKPITRYAEMFIPLYLEKYWSEATLTGPQGESAPLVGGSKAWLDSQDAGSGGGDTPLTPLRASLLLLMVTAALSIYGLKRRKSLWGFDALLFAVSGLAGCLLAFMSLFSQHPAVSRNFMLLVLHPLHLVLMPWFMRRIRRRERSVYLLCNACVLTAFLLSWAFIPQHINAAVLPLTLCLLLRSTSHLVLSYRKAA